MDIEKIVYDYLIENDIPCYSKQSKKSFIIAIIYGYRKSGMSSSTFARFNKKYFPLKTKGVKTLNYILISKKLKHCKKCNIVKSLEEFNNNSSKEDGKQSWCRLCHYTDTKLKQPSLQAKRRAILLERIPKWSNQLEIDEFYTNCPEGCHVDHIIPLQGELVSGLHVIENLQYLKIVENLKKGNKFEVL